MTNEEQSQAAVQLNGGQSGLSLRTLAIRLVVIWFLIGQMVLVCLPASTTRPLCRLESVYAFQPSSANKAALDNEFDRVAAFESQRAIGRFAVLLLVDVVIIAFCWNVGSRQRRRNLLVVPSPVLARPAQAEALV